MEKSMSEDTSAIFTHNIRWLRRRYGLSRRKMAQVLEIGRWSLDKLERGEIPPRMTVDILFAVQKNFGVSPSDQLSQRLGE